MEIIFLCNCLPILTIWLCLKGAVPKGLQWKNERFYDFFWWTKKNLETLCFYFSVQAIERLTCFFRQFSKVAGIFDLFESISGFSTWLYTTSSSSTSLVRLSYTGEEGSVSHQSNAFLTSFIMICETQPKKWSLILLFDTRHQWQTSSEFDKLFESRIDMKFLEKFLIRSKIYLLCMNFKQLCSIPGSACVMSVAENVDNIFYYDKFCIICHADSN